MRDGEGFEVRAVEDVLHFVGATAARGVEQGLCVTPYTDTRAGAGGLREDVLNHAIVPRTDSPAVQAPCQEA